jgi:ketosteroid isomerase-like protein
MTTESSRTDNEAQIRHRIESWARALRTKKLDELMSHYAQDILVFDLAPPLQYVGIDAYRSNFEEWLLSFQGSIGYEIRDLSITTGDNVAFSRSLNRISGRRTNGEQTDVWVRATVCFRKIDGKWKVVHEHVSVPFYMEPPYRASLDLKP